MLNDKQIEPSTQMIVTLKKALLNQKISQLQFSIYSLLLSIPEGKVTTYKSIAKEIKCNSARAIGQALRKNPFAPEVPCHRVVKTNLALGGFAGSITNKTVEKKMKLLQSEGIAFQPIKEDQWSEAKVHESHIWPSKNK